MADSYIWTSVGSGLLQETPGHNPVDWSLRQKSGFHLNKTVMTCVSVTHVIN